MAITQKINSTLYYLTNLASPSSLWILDNQAISPPVPQNNVSYGYINIISLFQQTLGTQKNTYIESKDKININVRTYYQVTASLDVRSKDLSASDTITDVMNAVFLESVKEYFSTNDVGFVKFQGLQNLSSIVTGQIMRRFTVDIILNVLAELNEEVDRIIEAPVNYNFST